MRPPGPRSSPAIAREGPTTASRWRRSAATGTDLLLALLLSGLSATSLGRWCARRAVLALAIDDPQSWWRGPVPLVLGILGELVYSLPVTMLLVALSRRAFGHTPGELWWRVPARSETWGRWLDDHAPLLLLTLALLVGDLRSTEILLAGIVLWGIRRILVRRMRRSAIFRRNPS